MKLNKFIAISLTLATVSFMQAVDVATLTGATTNLLNAQTALSKLINPNGDNNNNNNFSNQPVGVIQTTVTNNTPTTIYLIVLDASNAQINNKITLKGKDYTYLPIQAAAIKVVDGNNNQLVEPTTVTLNTPYAISYIQKKWAIAPLGTTTTYSYKNSTNIPLVVTITINNIEFQEQVAAGNNFTQTINPSTPAARQLFLSKNNFSIPFSSMVSVKAHANLSPVASQLNNGASYSITVANNKLVCTQTSSTGNAIINNSGWPMLVNFTNNHNDFIEQIALDNGNSYQPNNNPTHYLITPLIKDTATSLSSATTFSITNNKGELSF